MRRPPRGHILVSQRLLTAVEHLVEAEPYKEVSLKGFHRTLSVYNVIAIKN